MTVLVSDIHSKMTITQTPTFPVVLLFSSCTLIHIVLCALKPLENICSQEHLASFFLFQLFQVAKQNMLCQLTYCIDN